MKNKILIILVLLLTTVGVIFFLYQKRENDLKIVPLSARASFLTTKRTLANIAAPHLEEMIMDAEKGGMCLIVVEGYRTKEKQQKIYNEAKDKSIVAIPGTSEHETGLAVDLGGCPMNELGVRDDTKERLELEKDFKDLPEYQWLLQNASKYGFRQSYTEDNTKQTGFPAEPWHWKFIYKTI